MDTISIGWAIGGVSGILIFFGTILGVIIQMQKIGSGLQDKAEKEGAEKERQKKLRDDLDNLGELMREFKKGVYAKIENHETENNTKFNELHNNHEKLEKQHIKFEGNIAGEMKSIRELLERIEKRMDL